MKYTLEERKEIYSRPLEEQFVPMYKEGDAIVYRKNEPELRDAVWEILKEMQADGTVTAISQKWFGRDISTIK